jgi:hypothetical protein
VREVKENIDAREDEAVKVEDCEKGREVGRLTGHAEPMDVDLKSRAIDEELRKSHRLFSERPHLA